MPAETAARVADMLAEARQLGVARLDAQLLLSHHLNRPRAWLLAHDEVALTVEQTRATRHGLARRAAGEPLAYVIGTTRFRGMTLAVSPAVLVPRPETELLVEWALDILRARLRDSTTPTPMAVVDLGTGSGAVALAVAVMLEPLGVTVCATDASAPALAVAASNAQSLGITLELRLGDWWAPLHGRRFDLAMSNPPYIAAGDVHLAALHHEPAAALSPGGDGLHALQTLVGGAAEHLLPGGWLLLEHGHDQGAAVRGGLAAAGFTGIETRNDLAGLPRCSGGVLTS